MTDKPCPHCGQDIGPWMAFCPLCGEQLKGRSKQAPSERPSVTPQYYIGEGDRKRCTECYSVSESPGSFCPICGAHFEQVAAPSAS